LSRKHKSLPKLEGVAITDLAAEGKALARVNDKVVFVPLGAPGDVVDIQLTRMRHQYAEGVITGFQERSPLRVDPFCTHFGVCGGCQWQHLPYAEQLKYKQKQVYDALVHIGKLKLPDQKEGTYKENVGNGSYAILGSAKTQFYRNKLEFTFSNRRWLSPEQKQRNEEAVIEKRALGFHMPGLFDKVLDIENCWLQNSLTNKLRLTVKQFCLDQQYSFYDQRTHTGLMRNLIVRLASSGEIMVIVVFAYEDRERMEKLLHYIADTFPTLTSLITIVNEKWNDSLTDLPYHVFKGHEYLQESMENLTFMVGPKSFYQTNSQQAVELYRTVRHFAALSGNELVYDLYTGTGTIALFLAASCRQVIGIEYVPEAIEDARKNAEINHIQRADFLAGDMKEVLTAELVSHYGKPDVLITDPPRSGMHADVVNMIHQIAPRKIVYVSCNPATQARDLALLKESYRITQVQPVDMFPHTQHVENVVLLEINE
jgi:23S rRNA (uracil1939-C5)-methyltransferase